MWLTARPAESEPLQRKLTSFKSNKVYENSLFHLGSSLKDCYQWCILNVTKIAFIEDDPKDAFQHPLGHHHLSYGVSID
jgi:hypothetical protein